MKVILWCCTVAATISTRAVSQAALSLSQNTNSSYAWNALWCIKYAPNMHILQRKKKNILAPFQSLSPDWKKSRDVCISRDSQIQNYQTNIGLSLTFHDFESLVFVLTFFVCILKLHLCKMHSFGIMANKNKKKICKTQQAQLVKQAQIYQCLLQHHWWYRKGEL